MQKRIVVLGGVGFIGTHLCLRLLDEGHEVFCVDTRDIANSPLLRDMPPHPEFRYVRHNIVHQFGIRCDEIYNLASPSRVRYNKALPVETGNIYAANCRDTAEESGFCTTRRILAEGKRAAEAMHRAYQSEFGVDARIARIFNTYGTGADLMDQRVVMKMIVAALQNRDIPINGSGEQLRTFCWVEDVVDGLVRLMDAPPTETARTINFGSNHEVSIRALAEKIVALTGSRSQIVHTDARADDVRRLAPDISAARRELGWEPRTPLVEGLRRTISYAEKELADKTHAGMTWAEIS